MKNNGVLPLDGAICRIAIIGGHADAGALSGGGSAQVLPVGHAMTVPLGGEDAPLVFYDRSAPLTAIRSIAPRAAVSLCGRALPQRSRHARAPRRRCHRLRYSMGR